MHKLVDKYFAEKLEVMQFYQEIINITGYTVVGMVDQTICEIEYYESRHCPEL